MKAENFRLVAVGDDATEIRENAAETIERARRAARRLMMKTGATECRICDVVGRSGNRQYPVLETVRATRGE